jgi:hypothetical protein
MADPTVFSYTLQDDEGLKSNTSFYVAYDGATLLAQNFVDAWLHYGALLDAVTDAQITGGSVTIPLIADGAWKSPAASGNNVNQVMNLNFNNDFNSYATSILIPAYKEAILTPELTPDLADTALAAFITAMLDGYSLLTNVTFPNSRDLHDLNALRDAFLTVRKVRNQKRHTIVSP